VPDFDVSFRREIDRENGVSGFKTEACEIALVRAQPQQPSLRFSSNASVASKTCEQLLTGQFSTFSLVCSLEKKKKEVAEIGCKVCKTG
jgi:hypothetical protein